MYLRVCVCMCAYAAPTIASSTGYSATVSISDLSVAK